MTPEAIIQHPQCRVVGTHKITEHTRVLSMGVNETTVCLVCVCHLCSSTNLEVSNDLIKKYTQPQS